MSLGEAVAYHDYLGDLQKQQNVVSLGTFEQKVEAYIAKWQKRLRLMDFEIKPIIEREDRPYMAISKCYPSFQAAELLIVHPDFYPKETAHGVNRDLECTILHELLHVRTCTVPDVVAQWQQSGPAWEAMIDLMAQAMLAADRGQERFDNNAPVRI